VALPKAKSGLREQQEHRLPGSPCSIFRFVGNELGEVSGEPATLGIYRMCRPLLSALF